MGSFYYKYNFKKNIIINLKDKIFSENHKNFKDYKNKKA